jgi:hypothetical protein
MFDTENGMVSKLDWIFLAALSGVDFSASPNLGNYQLRCPAVYN